MDGDSRRQAPGRRNFLKLASLGAVASTVTAVSGKAAEATEVVETTGREGGYRETPHVRKYYELARF